MESQTKISVVLAHEQLNSDYKWHLYILMKNGCTLKPKPASQPGMLFGRTLDGALLLRYLNIYSQLKIRSILIALSTKPGL